LVHLQSAIDRAVIDLRHDGVHKHARLKREDYLFADFELSRPRDGGFILDLVNAGPLKIVDRINAAIKSAYGVATRDALPVLARSLNQQAEHLQTLHEIDAIEPSSLRELHTQYGSTSANRRYADRSINKEINQVLTQLRVERYSGSTLDLTLAGTDAYPIYRFNSATAEKFNKVVSTRMLGDPVLISITIRAMDGGTRNGKKTGKAALVGSNRDFILHFRSAEDFNRVAPYMRAGDDRPAITIVASPVIEYGTFDTEAGDMFFIDLVRA